MRVIGAGLAVFLAVIAVLLYQVVPGSGKSASLSAIASSEPTSTSSTMAQPTATLTHAPMVLSATATIARAASTPTPTPMLIAPTVEVIQEASVASTASADVDDDSNWNVDPVDEPQVHDEADEGASEDSATDRVSLASVDPSGAWNGAIETPNGGMIGIVLSGLANVRALPQLDADVVNELHAGWPVAIYGVAIGDTFAGSDLWYQVSGGFVNANLLGPYVPAEPEEHYAGHWVDVDITNNIAVAYIGNTPVNAVTVITGKTGFETPLGFHTIFARVENEILDSATVGVPEGDPEYYYLPDVPYTQYFATGGFAIHGNYWSDDWQFGSSLSHGCVNMFSEDAEWFWWFLDIGSVVNVHY